MSTLPTSARLFNRLMHYSRVIIGAFLRSFNVWPWMSLAPVIASPKRDKVKVPTHVISLPDLLAHYVAIVVNPQRY